jgi:putative oxidoreductase
MRVFGDALGRLAGAVPVAVRVIIGGMMFFHGVDKLDRGPAGFGDFLASEGVPLGEPMGWVVSLLELVGGLMLVIGLLSRPVALVLAVELVFAIIIVSAANGLIGEDGVGYERDLAYIAGFITVALLGPGRPSADHALGLEHATPVLADASVTSPGRAETPSSLSPGSRT